MKGIITHIYNASKNVKCFPLLDSIVEQFTIQGYIPSTLNITQDPCNL